MNIEQMSKEQMKWGSNCGVFLFTSSFICSLFDIPQFPISSAPGTAYSIHLIRYAVL